MAVQAEAPEAAAGREADSGEVEAPPPPPPPCRFGLGCVRAECVYDHPPGWVAASLPCRSGGRCRRTRCPFEHPFDHDFEWCIFGPGCAEKGCVFDHDRSRSPPAARARPCRYRGDCCVRTCPFAHPPGWSPVLVARSLYARNVELAEAEGGPPPCRFGRACLLPGCAYGHPPPLRGA
jgi:hypothetical protein